MTRDIYWYTVIISAYYSFIVGPICKDYLFSSIQHRWGNVSFVMIVIEVTVFFDVVVRVEIYCPCTAVLVFTFHFKYFFTEIFVTNFLTVA